MCAVRLSGLGRGDGIAGVVLAWSSGVGLAGGVVMAGVLAHHLQRVGEYAARTNNELAARKVRFTTHCVMRRACSTCRWAPRYRYRRVADRVAGGLYPGRPPG